MARSARASSRKSRKTEQQKYIECPTSGDKVWICKATLSDIRTAKENGKKNFPHKKELVKVPSAKVRCQLYEESAQAIQDLECRQLPRYGGRPWKVTCRINDQGVSSPYFRWYRGRLELACLPHLIERIPEPPRFPGYRRAGNDGDEEEDSSEYDDADPDDRRRMNELQERAISALSTVAWEYRNMTAACGGAPIPNVTLKWVSPLRTLCYSRKVAWDHAMELAKNEMFIDKIIHGLGSTGRPLAVFYPSRPQALKAGRMRFIRDGLWVVGQEYSWQMERIKKFQSKKDEDSRENYENGNDKEKPVSRKRRRTTGLSYYLHCNRDQRLRQMKQEDESWEDPSEIQHNRRQRRSLTLRQAETELRAIWKTLRLEEQHEWEEKADVYEENLKHMESRVEDIERVDVEGSVDPSIESEIVNGKSAKQRNPKNVPNHTKSIPVTKNDFRSTLQRNPDSGLVGDGVGSKPTCTMLDNGKSAANKTAKKCKSKPSRGSHTMFANSTHWRLTPEQVKLCHDAAIEHFEKVMRTVNARDLSRELEAGFDLLRERGRGRYDMELPEFDDSKFDFLNSTKNAPWMPVVHKILGVDVVLIHKGIFLSLPGAQTQVYHQDGLHLNTQTQKPCHAINVFVPLVDLNHRNGATEFCIGTHVLGQEDYDREYIEIPKVKAGTPVIFDYRLGHRGLANTSSMARPIVYCTYAAAANGKEFRDSVNFSRRRYKKIGELVEKPASREERLKKRKLNLLATRGEHIEN